MSGLPKPPWVLVVLSVVVIAICSLLVSFALAAIVATWDPCSVFSGVITFPFPAALGLQQYRGTFHRVRSAAVWAAALLFIVSALAAFALICIVGGTSEHNSGANFLVSTLVAIAIAVVCCWGAWLNLEWSHQLPKSVPQDKWQFSIQELLVVISTFGIVVGMTTSIVRTTPPRYAENVSVGQAPFGLPPEATDVSFCQGYRGMIAYEFTVDEKSFCRWVASGIGSFEAANSGVRLKPITTPESIHRYYFLSTDLKGPDKITVKEGLHYSWSFEDRGVSAIFDASTNRAYYFAHYH